MSNEVKVVGIDLAKHVFQIHGCDARGKKLFSKQLRRKEVLVFMAQLPRCLVGMEACGGAHWWARKLREMGHEVRLMAPQYVRPYVMAQKNDRSDAAAIAEAVTRPQMHFVAVKEGWQQDILSVHRVRNRLIQQRIALTNQMRGLLQEYGIVMPQGAAALRLALATVLEDADNGLSLLMRQVVDGLRQEWQDIENRLEQWDRQLHQMYTADETCRQLGRIEGIGPITATALVATIGDASVFKNGRQMAAWLGLVPRQHSSGGKERLGRISKRGDQYVRSLLVHGARSVLCHLGEKQHWRARWLRDKYERRGFNKACVALANKNARVVWAVMRYKEPYQVSA